MARQYRRVLLFEKRPETTKGRRGDVGKRWAERWQDGSKAAGPTKTNGDAVRDASDVVARFCLCKP